MQKHNQVENEVVTKCVSHLEKDKNYIHCHKYISTCIKLFESYYYQKTLILKTSGRYPGQNSGYTFFT